MSLIRFLKQVFSEFGQDKAGTLSAALAYVAVFSIGPLLLTVISLLGLIYGERAAQGQLYTQLTSVIGPDTAKTLQNVVLHSHQSGSGPALVVGIIGTLLAAAALTTQLQNALNIIFKVVPDPAGGIKQTVWVKFKNVLITVLGGLTVMASVVISALVIGLGNRVRHYVDLPPGTLEVLNSLASLAVFVLVLYLIYKIVPDVKIPRRLALAASTSIALLFLVGKIVLGIIIGRNSTASAYGAAASLVTLLLWVYYSSQIIFLGAEGIKVYADQRSLLFNPKGHNLKRDTVHLDHRGLPGRLAEAFSRGFKKKAG
jgi:membrane protein